MLTELLLRAGGGRGDAGGGRGGGGAAGGRGGAGAGGGGRGGGGGGRGGARGRDAGGGHAKPGPVSGKPDAPRGAHGGLTGRVPTPKPNLGPTPKPRTKPDTTTTPNRTRVPNPRPNPNIGPARQPVPKPAPAAKPHSVEARNLPVRGRITSPYGEKRGKDPKTGKEKIHHGVDIRAAIGTPVKATGGGTVTRAGWQDEKDHSKGYGIRVTIDHGNGNTSTYGHLDSCSVKKGDKVTKGQTIGKSGNTGHSTAPHVHYDEKYKGKPHSPTYDPERYNPGIDIIPGLKDYF